MAAITNAESEKHKFETFELLQLDCGRKVSYQIFGSRDSSARTVFYFHGNVIYLQRVSIFR